MFLTPNRVPVALGKPLTSLKTVFIGTIFNENFKIFVHQRGDGDRNLRDGHLKTNSSAE